MTENEWLGSEDPLSMLGFLRRDNPPNRMPPDRLAPDRKLRRFAVACAEAVETQAPGVKPGAGAWEGWLTYCDKENESMFSSLDGARYWAGAKVGQHHVHPLTENGRCHAASLLREIIGNPFRPVSHAAVCSRCDGTGGVRVFGGRGGISEPGICERCQGKGFHDKLGVNSKWLTANVISTTQEIYDQRDFSLERMLILRETLLDAGCDSEEILRHLAGEERCECFPSGDGYRSRMVKIKSGGLCRLTTCELCQPWNSGWRRLSCGHVKGCWVLDLIRGKS